jgi:hypothetical protein
MGIGDARNDRQVRKTFRRIHKPKV